MIRVSIKEKEDINRALKRFKKKFEKSQVIKDYRSNAFYTKKSVMLREELFVTSKLISQLLHMSVSQEVKINPTDTVSKNSFVFMLFYKFEK